MADARHFRSSKTQRPERAINARRRRTGLVLAGLTAAGGAGMIASAVGAGATGADPQVTLCHASSSKTNPYIEETVDAAGAFSHLDNTGPVFAAGMTNGWGDIIPPFEYNGQIYSLNWPAGQAFVANHCKIPDTTPTTTVTATATQTVTAPPETKTVTQTDTATVTAPASTVTETVTAPPQTVTQTVTDTATKTETATETVTAPPVTQTVTQTVPAAVSTSNSSSSSESTSAGAGVEGGAVSSSNTTAGGTDNAGVAAAAAAGPIPAGADAGQHAPITRNGVAIWGALLMVIGGAAGLGFGFRPQWRRGH